jgi:dihydropteroate synthase
MGILNVTPNSFSDGGRFARIDVALKHAAAMINAGAAIIDVGGESTRPGAQPVGSDEELERVVPVIEALRREHDVLLSVDTMKPEVMTAAVAAGAGLINDVLALQAPGAVSAAAASGAAVCLMHMQGTPQTMQAEPTYSDVVVEVGRFLSDRVAACVDAGIPRSRIVLDPGFGFGKTLEHNFALLKGLPALCAQGLPVLAGLSRKALLGKLLKREVDQRLPGSLALATAAVLNGAMIIRCHDVAETRDAVAVAWAAKNGVV